MDELEFRRQAYAEPKCLQKDFLHACRETPQRQKFIGELKLLDAKIEAALNVEPPRDLADKLVLTQQLQQHQKQRKFIAVLLAAAASIAIVVGVSFAMLRLSPVNLAEHALAHVYHEPRALTSDYDISFEQVNAQLASLSALEHENFHAQPSKIYYSTYCDFQGVRSLHLVMQGLQDKVSVFIVPKEQRMKLEEHFSDSNYQGVGFDQGNAYIVLVGNRQQALDTVRQEIQQTFI